MNVPASARHNQKFPPPRYISGLLSWCASQAFCMNKTNYSEQLLQKFHVRVHLVEIAKKEDLKCVYMSTTSET